MRGLNERLLQDLSVLPWQVDRRDELDTALVR